MKHGAGWLVIALLMGACGPTTTEAPRAAAESVTALVGGPVQVAPEGAAVAEGVVVIRDGLITAVRRPADVRVPAGARGIALTGGAGPPGVLHRPAELTEPA